MARRVDQSKRADETVTVRLPYGTADKMRAASGQPFSKLIRFMCLSYLERAAKGQGGSVNGN